MFKIINENEAVQLNGNQAVILCKYEEGILFDLIPAGLSVRVESENRDSITLALNEVVTKAIELGFELVQEDPIIEMAKSRALDAVFSSHEDEYWEYALYCAKGQITKLFNSHMVVLCELYSGDRFNRFSDVAKMLDVEFSAYMRFAEFVKQQQPKTWLLTTDYDGGSRESWVVKGSHEDAKASMIEALNELTDRHVDADNFDDFISNHTGQSEDYIFTTSIEEVE